MFYSFRKLFKKYAASTFCVPGPTVDTNWCCRHSESPLRECRNNMQVAELKRETRTHTVTQELLVTEWRARLRRRVWVKSLASLIESYTVRASWNRAVKSGLMLSYPAKSIGAQRLGVWSLGLDCWGFSSGSTITGSLALGKFIQSFCASVSLFIKWSS